MRTATTLRDGARICALLLWWCWALMGPGAVPAGAADSFTAGLKAARAGNLNSAILHWTKTLRRNPKSYAALVNRGSAYFLTGRILKGVKDWRKAKEYSPIFAYGYCSTHFIDQARKKRRILSYAKALEISPDHVPSVVMMGAAYLDFGQEKAAIDLFENSVELTKNPLLKSLLKHWVESLEDSESLD